MSLNSDKGVEGVEGCRAQSSTPFFVCRNAPDPYYTYILKNCFVCFNEGVEGVELVWFFWDLCVFLCENRKSSTPSTPPPRKRLSPMLSLDLRA